MTQLEKIKEDEIDLLDLLKVIIKNRKILIIIWALVVAMGISFGVYTKKVQSVQGNRKFGIRVLQTEAVLNMDPTTFYENQNFVDKFFEEELIKDKSRNIKNLNEIAKKNFIKNIFEINKESSNFSLKISAKSIEELKELETMYFKILQSYLKDNFGSILKKDLELQQKNSLIFKEELTNIEKRITELSKGTKENYSMEDVKELNPTIFAEKNSIADVYMENYKNQKKIENNIAKLDDLIVYQSTLNKMEEKMSIKLIFIISNVLGIFLGVFMIFVREFLKGVNWKELKEIE